MENITMGNHPFILSIDAAGIFQITTFISGQEYRGAAPFEFLVPRELWAVCNYCINTEVKLWMEGGGKVAAAAFICFAETTRGPSWTLKLEATAAETLIEKFARLEVKVARLEVLCATPQYYLTFTYDNIHSNYSQEQLFARLCASKPKSIEIAGAKNLAALADHQYLFIEWVDYLVSAGLRVFPASEHLCINETVEDATLLFSEAPRPGRIYFFSDANAEVSSLVSSATFVDWFRDFFIVY